MLVSEVALIICQFIEINIKRTIFLVAHRFRTFGDQLAQRSAEDIAYAVLRFFAKGGTLVNYYMVCVLVCFFSLLNVKL